MKKILPFILSVTALFVFVGSVGAAVLGTPTAKPTKPVKPTKAVTVTKTVPTLTAERCEAVKTKLQARAQHYKDNKDAHFRNYQEARDMMLKLFDKLDAKGYVTADARTKLAEMDTKMTALKSEVDKVAADLEVLKNTPCADFGAQYKAALKKAHEDVKVVYRSEQELVKFYRTQVREVVKGLKAQKKGKVTPTVTAAAATATPTVTTAPTATASPTPMP